MTEIDIVQFLNQIGRGTIVDNIAIVISYIPLLVVVWFVLGMLCLKFDKKKGRMVFLSIIVTVLIYFVVNDFVFKSFLVEFFGLRLRPYLAHPGEIFSLGPKFTDSSFPSGHVASSVAVLSVFIYYYKKYWLPATLFVLIMVFARMHMGMHYPSDVLAGAVFGLIYAYVGIKIARGILRRRSDRGE